MYPENLNISEMFTYHPPQTEERRELHDKVNKAAENLARLVWYTLDVKDPNRQKFCQDIQLIRMLLNQQITYSELQQLKQEDGDNATSDTANPGI